MNKKFLVYLDILGFEELAKEIEINENVRSEIVRKEFFINPLKEEIKKLKDDGKIIGEKPIADDWILVIDDIENLFECISRIIRIKIDNKNYINKPKKKYSTIPFEIVIGSYEFNLEKLDGDEIICADNTINYLKSNLIKEYRNFYKNRYSKRITETFVIAGESFINELSWGMRKYLVKSELKYFDEKDKVNKKYFLINKDNILKEGRIPEFLMRIGQSCSDFSGAFINRLYVPPDEYNKILKKLKKDRIIFITGTAGYGKTYTAIRFLWEWYNKGYTPKWIVGKEEKQRENVRERLANIDAELKPGHIIYFEDPFGRTKYERRDDLKEKMNFIINSIKNKEDVYAIITSRRDVFEQFEKESYSVESIKKFEEQLNILRPSYSEKKRIEILEKWAEEKGCEWLKHNRLKRFVFESLADEKTLPTPLNIHDFVIATTKVKSRIELEQELNKYSEEGEKAFADEIKGLYYSGRQDRVVFLSFIFISQDFDFNFIKNQYEQMKHENYEDFEKIIEEEHRVKQEIGELVDEEFEEESGIYWKPPNYFLRLKFSHPSYSKALSYILEDSGCKRIFFEVLKKVADESKASRNVIKVIAENFNKIPENIRNELFLKLADRSEATEGLVNIIVVNFDKLPNNIQKILFKLSEKGWAARYVVRAIGENFDKFPGNIRNELLLRLADKYEAAEDLANIIVENFNKLPNNVQNILFTLSQIDKVARFVARAIRRNFDKIPENIRNELLLRLADKYEAAEDLANIIVENFNKLPNNVQNILFIFANNKVAAWYVIWAIVLNFKKLPDNIQNLLFDLADRDYAAWYVLWAIAIEFYELPENVQNLLYRTSIQK